MLKELGIYKSALSPELALRASQKALEKFHRLSSKAHNIINRIERNSSNLTNLDYEDIDKLQKQVSKDKNLLEVANVMRTSADKHLNRAERFNNYAFKKVDNLSKYLKQKQKFPKGLKIILPIGFGTGAGLIAYDIIKRKENKNVKRIGNI